MSMYVHRIGSPIKPKTPSDVRYGSLADIGERIRDVRFTPESGHDQRQHRRPLSANSGRLPVRLLEVTGERRLAACSLVEGAMTDPSNRTSVAADIAAQVQCRS